MKNLKNKPSAEETPERTLRKEALDELVHAVRRDAQREPKEYLEETIVPGGGE